MKNMLVLHRANYIAIPLLWTGHVGMIAGQCPQDILLAPALWKKKKIDSIEPYQLEMTRMCLLHQGQQEGQEQPLLEGS